MIQEDGRMRLIANYEFNTQSLSIIVLEIDCIESDDILFHVW